MRSLIAFEQVSLDGFFVDASGDMGWAHKQDAEWNAFTANNAQGGGVMLFGRVTYDLMQSFWPTPAAMETLPEVAKAMNDLQKFVFSRTLDQASWNNTTLVKDDIVAETRKLKQQAGPGMVIMGSGKIVSQFAQAGLIDEYQIVVNPIVLGKGRTLFEGVQEKIPLRRIKTRPFENGNVVLSYEPMA